MLTGSVSWDLESPSLIGQSEVAMWVGANLASYASHFLLHPFATASSPPLCWLQTTATAIIYTTATVFRRPNSPPVLYDSSHGKFVRNPALVSMSASHSCSIYSTDCTHLSLFTLTLPRPCNPLRKRRITTPQFLKHTTTDISSSSIFNSPECIITRSAARANLFQPGGTFATRYPL